MQIEAVNTRDFRFNSYFENLAKLRDEKPDLYKILSPSEKLTLQVYLEQKQQAQEVKQTINLPSNGKVQ